MKPICVPCQRFFSPKKNDFKFIEGMPLDSDVAPGKAMDDKWRPYKLWAGDLWECKGCGASIVVGVAQLPLAEHYESDFLLQVQYHNPQLQVNDC